MGAVFTAPSTHAARPLAGQLGCAFDEGLLGADARGDETKQTTLPGAYATGDAATATGKPPWRRRRG